MLYLSHFKALLKVLTQISSTSAHNKELVMPLIAKLLVFIRDKEFSIFCHQKPDFVETLLSHYYVSFKFDPVSFDLVNFSFIETVLRPRYPNLSLLY